METNDQNRNFTVSTKVTANQKARYIQQAKKHELSLSEWMCGTLDMSINAYDTDNKQTSQIRELKMEISKKDDEIAKNISDLEKAKMNLNIKDAKILRLNKTMLKFDTTNPDLTVKKENIIMENTQEVINNNKTIQTDDFFGLITSASLLIGIIFLGKR